MPAMTHSAVRRYEDLVHEFGVLDGLAYAVVEGLTGPLPADTVVRRMGGDPTAPVDDSSASAYTNPFELPKPRVYSVQHGERTVLLFEPFSCELIRSEVLRRLSDNARVHSVYWNITGAERLSYAASGKLLTVKKMFDPTEPGWGDQPDLLDEDITDAVDDLLAGDRLDCHPGALALAVVEARTGVRPPAELFNYSLPPVALTARIPNDPAPAP